MQAIKKCHVARLGVDGFIAHNGKNIYLIRPDEIPKHTLLDFFPDNSPLPDDETAWQEEVL